jgi:hypothetical protein
MRLIALFAAGLAVLLLASAQNASNVTVLEVRPEMEE